MPRESGAILIDGQQVASTLRCVHCGGHFTVIKGSGKQRGFCLGCMGPTCGEQKCLEHIPFEKKLDLIEAGKMPLSKL